MIATCSAAVLTAVTITVLVIAPWSDPAHPSGGPAATASADLDRAITVQVIRATPRECLEEINRCLPPARRLNFAMPASVGRSGPPFVSIDGQAGVAIRQTLDTIASQARLRWEFHDGLVFLWTVLPDEERRGLLSAMQGKGPATLSAGQAALRLAEAGDLEGLRFLVLAATAADKEAAAAAAADLKRAGLLSHGTERPSIFRRLRGDAEAAQRVRPLAVDAAREPLSPLALLAADLGLNEIVEPLFARFGQSAGIRDGTAGPVHVVTMEGMGGAGEVTVVGGRNASEQALIRHGGAMVVDRIREMVLAKPEGDGETLARALRVAAGLRLSAVTPRCVEILTRPWPAEENRAWSSIPSAAGTALVEGASPDAAAVLGGMLEREDLEHHLFPVILEGLGRTNDPGAVPFLERVARGQLPKSGRGAAQEATEMVVRMGGRGIEVVSPQDGNLRGAVQALGQIRVPEAIQALRSLLDVGADVARQAAMVLSRRHHSEGASALRRMLLADKAPDQQGKGHRSRDDLAAAYGDSRLPAVVQDLLRMLASDADRERRIAVHGLARTRDPQAIKAMVGFARTCTDPALGRVAVQELGRCQDAEVEALFGAILDGKDAELRVSVLSTIVECAEREGYWQRVLALVKDPEARVRERAVACLRRLIAIAPPPRREDARRLLAEAVNDADPKVAATARRVQKGEGDEPMDGAEEITIEPQLGAVAPDDPF